MQADLRTVRIIACEVFRPFIKERRIRERFPGLNITFLPANLHMDQYTLKFRLLEEFRLSEQMHERVICMYGECFPDIDICCREHGVQRIPGHHCYEVLLGTETFHDIIEENARSYFLEQELILNFDKYCIEPLELYDEEMKELFFSQYDRLVYIRQPADPELTAEIRKISDYLELSVLVRGSDYSYLDMCLTEQLRSIFEEETNGEKQK